MTTEPVEIQSAHSKASFRIEFIAGLSTYLTMSYIFLLNPILLQKAGIDVRAAFFGTVISASLATFLMGVWAKVPFAVAPAPSITTFFVSYVCLQMGLPWQAALGAVVLSGILSIGMAALSVRQRLIDSIPPALGIGILFALSGFLIANGLMQAKVISYSHGYLDISSLSLDALTSKDALLLYVGLAVTVLCSQKWISFSGAPLLGIIVASIVAASFGIKATPPAGYSYEMFSAMGKVDFSPLLSDLRFLAAILIFFIIDFFGGVGKYIGLFSAMGRGAQHIPAKNLERALYVDGIGNIIGGFLGASSLAVFISSAVGIVAGGRTGLTAIVTAFLMLASLLVMPLVGAIPVQATAGILVYVGYLLIPRKQLRDKECCFTRLDLAVSVFAGLVSFATYGIDKAMLLVFVAYSALIIRQGEARKHIIMLVVTGLLLVAVIAQSFQQ